MPSDLEAWEQENGKIPDDVILLVFFGWGKHWPDKKKYLGTETKNTSLLHFPGKLIYLIYQSARNFYYYYYIQSRLPATSFCFKFIPVASIISIPLRAVQLHRGEFFVHRGLFLKRVFLLLSKSP